MKPYRTRGLRQKVQLAKPGPDGKPLRDATGQIQLDIDGQWFYVVSRGADRVRLLPVDHVAFFNWKAEQATKGLQAKGKTGAVTPDRLYEHYVAKFTRPTETYAPPGHPEEFSVVLSKHLAVNTTHGYGGTSRTDPDDVLIDDLSVLAGLMSDEVTTPTPTGHTPEEPPTRKRKKAPQPEAEAEVGNLGLDKLLG